MSLESSMVDAIYGSAVACDATYTDAGGSASAVRVIPVHDPDTLFGLSEIGVSGPRIAFRVRKSELTACPQKGDRIAYESVDYCVDHGQTEVNETEWLLYVVK